MAYTGVSSVVILNVWLHQSCLPKLKSCQIPWLFSLLWNLDWIFSLKVLKLKHQIWKRPGLMVFFSPACWFQSHAYGIIFVCFSELLKRFNSSISILGDTQYWAGQDPKQPDLTSKLSLLWGDFELPAQFPPDPSTDFMATSSLRLAILLLVCPGA